MAGTPGACSQVFCHPISCTSARAWPDTPCPESLEPPTPPTPPPPPQDVWDVYRDVLGVVPEEVVCALREAASRSAVDDFWSIWSRNAEAGLFRAYALAGGPTAAGSSAFLGRGLLRIRNRRLGVELLVAGVLVGCIVLVRVMMLMFIALSILFILLFLLFYSFVGVLSQLRMFLRVSRVKGLLNLGGMLC